MKILLGILGLLTVCVSSALSQAPASGSGSSFVIDVNRPYVYLLFDHVGKGPRFVDDEPSTRIWFKLVNNCKVPITVRTFGAPDASAKEEVGVMHKVVANVEVGRVREIPPPDINFSNIPEPSSRPSEKRVLMPRGYDFDVSSLAVILPQESLLFSIPTTHLSKEWHIEIPYEFEVPAGKCCRAEAVGGEPQMSLYYADWYLPEKIRRKLDRHE